MVAGFFCNVELGIAVEIPFGNSGQRGAGARNQASINLNRVTSLWPGEWKQMARFFLVSRAPFGRSRIHIFVRSELCLVGDMSEG